MRKSRIILLLTAFLILVSSSQAQKMLKPQGRILRDEGISQKNGFISDVSAKNLLGLERPTPFSLPVSKNGNPLTSTTASDTLNVLVLKIEFTEEIPDNPNTTGNGNFDQRSYDQYVADEGHYIDPAPHGTAYFNSHMEALNRYWYFVSDRQLNLTWDVYPQEEDQAFQLPNEMAYYGSDGPWTDIRDQLGYFFIHSITLADSLAPEIDFGSYQAVIVFHAGSDQQNNIAFINNTPDDFFTGFIMMAEPIYVDGGMNYVQEGLMMPETASQDNRVNAINGVLAHEFGHQLGLIDLYNTATFFTQVGDFALMDNNGMSIGVEFPDFFSTVGGTLPVYPSAWSRAYLGFNVPTVISNNDNNQLFAAATLDHSDSEIIKVPITDFEYFLIENRSIEVDTLAPGYQYDNILIGDSLTGVILGPGYAYFTPTDTVLVPDSEYDRLLPGNGALIWHVDEYQAYINSLPFYSEFNNFENNTLQWDKDRRFLSLVEADGVIEFGGNYHRGYGTARDMFRWGNNIELTPYSNPSSNSNLGADSHIFITNISGADTLMTLDIEIDWFLDGWPQFGFPNNESGSVLADLDNDASPEIILTAQNRLLIYSFNGEKFVSNTDSISVEMFDRTANVMPWGVAVECDTTIIDRPVVADFDDDGFDEIAVMTYSGNLYVYNITDNDSDGRLDLLPDYPMQIADSASLAPVAVSFLPEPAFELIAVDISGGVHFDSLGYDSLIYDLNARVVSFTAYSTPENNIIDACIFENDQLIYKKLLAESGSLDFTESVSLPIGYNPRSELIALDIDRDDGLPEVIVASDNKIMSIEHDGSISWQITTDNIVNSISAGDLNSDGFPEIVFTDSTKLYACNRQGFLFTNYPVDFSFYDRFASILAESVIADLDGDDNPDIILGLPNGSIHAYNYNADQIAGFPLPVSFGSISACAIGDLDNDGDIDVVTQEASGLIRAWDISSVNEPLNNPWAMGAGNQLNNKYLSPAFNKSVIVNDQHFAENSVYNYPNPAVDMTTIRYYLNSDSRVTIDIFDFMGERIHNVELDGYAHMDNEYVWNCSGIASGIYFCRVEADNGSSKKTRIVKIAIAK